MVLESEENSLETFAYSEAGILHTQVGPISSRDILSESMASRDSLNSVILSPSR